MKEEKPKLGDQLQNIGNNMNKAGNKATGAGCALRVLIMIM